ncbi:MAG: hypothetical protein JO190_11830 [Candidatus Eremiobacteraeota bacterium]|nr:hypothetical protein [Candidatus Eremiobacteraeota bacterium]
MLIPSILGNSNEGQKQNRAALRAIPVFEHAGEWSAVAWKLSVLAARAVQTGAWDNGEEMFERVERIRHEHAYEPNADWINILMHRSYAFECQGEFGKAEAAAVEAMQLARDLRQPTREMNASLLAAEISFARGDTRRAIALTTQTIEIGHNHRHVVFEILARSARAGYYVAEGDLELTRADARKVLKDRGDAAGWVFQTAILHLATAGAVSGNCAKDVALLKGYYDAHHTKVKDPSIAASHGTLTSALQNQLPAAEIARLEREGATLSDGEAAELALSL